MASLHAPQLVAILVLAAAVSTVQGIRYPLQAPSATFTPSNDDSSTVANTAAFLRSGKGSPTADASARAAQAAAMDALNAPTSRATLTPSNDEASDISDAITELSSHTGTPSQNAVARGKLSSAVAAATSMTSPPVSPRISKATGPPIAKSTLPPTGKLATPAAKLAAQIPKTTAPAGPGIPYTPTNDDSSTIENAVTYLQGGAGSTAGKAAATAALGMAIQDRGATSGNDEASGIAAASGAGTAAVSPKQAANLLSQATALTNALNMAQSGGSG